MKYLVIITIVVWIPFNAWADYGLSNTVKVEIQRPPAASLTTPELSGKQTPCEKLQYYPYTIHVSAWKVPEGAIHEWKMLSKRIKPMFVTKINLGNLGTWFRVDYGIFTNIRDAVFTSRALQKKNIISKNAFVGRPVPYTLEIGSYSSAEGALKKVQKLNNMGVITYTIKESDTCYRVLVGAYPDKNTAGIEQKELLGLGIKSRITKR